MMRASAASVSRDPVEALILDLLEWLELGPQSYAEALDRWRTSCPKLPVWEDAHLRGFVARTTSPGNAPILELTAAGRAHLRKELSQPPPECGLASR